MKLYGYWRSSSAWRARIGLQLKGLPHTYVPVHLVADGGQQHAADHVARNPLAQVPVLEVLHEGRVVRITQSLAILAWLDAAYPEVPLLPADPFERARAWELAEIVNSGIQPLQNLAVLQRIEALGGDRLAWGRDAIARGLAALEVHAEGCGSFLVGTSPSIADICLIPQLYNARRFGVALDGLPALLRVEAACEALPAFQAAHADQQPDAVPG